MANPIGRIFKPIARPLLIALSGFLFFAVSVAAMIPLRMAANPVENYNLFYVPILAIIMLVLFYRACVETIASRSYLYGFFAALAAWPLIGEVASMPVDKGLITQFSDVDIKVLGGWFYVVAGWILLKIMWLTGVLKKSICVFLLTFLSIWSFELYMDNYSFTVPLELMPVIATTIGWVFVAVSLVLLIIAWRSKSVEVKTVMGCVLYIALSLVIMGLGQWHVPQSHYVKYEALHIPHEIEELKQKMEHINYLREHMIREGIATPEQLGMTDECLHDHNDHTDHHEH